MTTTDAAPDPGASFPAGFTWGAATASYQIEGAADVDGRGPSIWDVFSHTPGRVLGGDTGDVACDHYHRYAQDVALMRELGLGAYRFSVAWPRVQPLGSGRVEQRGLDFYRRLVDELLGAGITPWLTLYHWDLPQALQDEGGWTSRDTAERFAEYAGIVHDALGDRVPHWSTLNEPWCSSLLSHQAGHHAPGERDGARAARAVHHLLLGHGLAAGVLRARGCADVGLTLNLAPILGEDPDVVRKVDGQQNRMWLDAVLLGRYPDDVVADLEAAGAPLPVQDGDLDVIRAPLDWLGVNYYFRTRVAGGSTAGAPSPWIGGQDVVEVEPPVQTTAMGWGVEPDGLLELLTRLRDEWPAVPLVITENGSAWPDVVSPDGAVHDPDRVDYLHRHLEAAARAVEQGVDLRGYFAWSLLDNFEWAFGYERRFGIVHVDYDTQVRTPKDSARAYAEVLRRHREAHA
jgi:beta-glucosidase